jgi:hypothetical protein
MKNELPTLITPDAQSGLALAYRLAGELHTQMDQAGSKVERPGGMNYLLPAAIPQEIIGCVLFYAIAAANNGWADITTTAAISGPENSVA